MLAKIESLSKIIAALFIPIAIAYMGNAITDAKNQRDSQTKLVEVAIEILNKDPTGKNKDEEKALREWAVKVVDLYSGVPLPKEVKTAIVDNKVKLPNTNAANIEESSTWGIIFGGDKSLKEAQYEITQAGKKGLPAGRIFLRAGSYRSVIIVGNRAEAEDLLGKVKKYRDSSYVVNMEKWCPNTVSQGTHFDCILT